MILLIDQRIVIVTPPKTASDTLHRVLCAPPWYGVAVVGPHHGVIDKHYPHVPNEAFGFRVLLAVRHPLDRLVSLWHHRCRLAAYFGEATETFECFARNVAAGQSGCWLWQTTIDELIGPQRIDGLLRAESLTADLTAAGLTVDSLPRWNDSYRRPWNEYYDSATLPVASCWGASDIQRFGY
jgi:hypothetical protein